MGKRLVAQWESRGGASFFVLYEDRWGYGYVANQAGGGIDAASDQEAIAYVERPTRWGRWVDAFQEMGNKTPMKRII